jgi:hypothetical protein
VGHQASVWSSEVRFAAYVERLAEALRHADGAALLNAYFTALILPGERKSVELRGRSARARPRSSSSVNPPFRCPSRLVGCGSPGPRTGWFARDGAAPTDQRAGLIDDYWEYIGTVNQSHFSPWRRSLRHIISAIVAPLAGRCQGAGQVKWQILGWHRP